MTDRTTTTTPLARRTLGTTGLEVTPLCIGSSVLGDMSETYGYGVSEERASATLATVFDSPVNFLDTAAIYGYGLSERRIGAAIAERRGLPDDFVLATKADRDPDTNDFSGDQVRRSVEESLERLGLDVLQLVYLHDPEHATFEGATAPGGAMEALEDLRDQGVIQHLGVAGGPIDLMIQYVATGRVEVVLTHNRYTLVDQSARRLTAAAAKRDVAVVNAAPYGGGILAGRSTKYGYREAHPDVQARVAKMQALCSEHNVPLAAAALQFSLRSPDITSTVIGISRPERLAETIDLAATEIPEALWPGLEALGLGEHSELGDLW